jgi:trehalose 6-phosphate phosphatase
MTASYLLTSEGLAALAAQVTPDTLFAFDLDGTLAPIVDDYSAAEVAAPVRATLERLAKLAKVAVITGRSRKTALEILGVKPHLLIGNHGAEWPDDPDSRTFQFAQICMNWKERLHERLSGVRGVEIEFKGESISIHYRKAMDREGAFSLINAAIGELAPSPKRIGGKYVVNLLPMEALGKGDALLAAMERLGLERTIFFGDDVTDEEIFKLGSVDLFGVHIGKDDWTAAAYYLNRQSEILGLLNSMVGTLESRKESADA